MAKNPHYLSQLAHLELYSPDVEKSVHFLRNVVGLDDIDVFELNEAFAAQSLACIRQLGMADNDPRINPNGGAIALGHPLGMSGTRLLQTLALELRHQQKRYGLAGQGYAVIIERIN